MNKAQSILLMSIILFAILIVLQLPVIAQVHPIFTVASPTEGQVVRPGDMLSIQITPSFGSLLKGYVVNGPLHFEVHEGTAPISFVVPDGSIGSVKLFITAANLLGVTQQIIRTIDIEPNMQATGISVEDTTIDLIAPGTGKLPDSLATAKVDITGHFPDLVDRDITGSPFVKLTSNNADIVSVGGNNSLHANAPGQAIVTISYLQATTSIIVNVNKFRVVGDLDGDDDVDKDDLRVLRKAFGKATGANDPRDLDHNGVIDSNDAKILKSLCTRPKCQTENNSANQTENDADEID